VNTRSVLVFAAAALIMAVPANAILKVGDPPPPMKIMKWVKGTPVTKFAKGKVYVVEFWATWCGPCRTSIPHITELAKKNKAVTFAGIDIWEREKGAARMANVTKFVKEMGAKMGYSVGMEDDAGTMAKTWMSAAGQNGIPAAFVIGKNGRIAWIGHPMELDSVLGPIVKGTFNAKAAAAIREKAEAEQAAKGKLLEPISKAIQANDFKTAVAELDNVFASHPDMEKDLAPAKYQFLFKVDEAAAFEYAKQLTEGLYKDNSRNLNAMAWMGLDEKNGPKVKDYPTIIAMAERANTLENGKDPNILDTLASAYAKSGDSEKAIATQELAIAAQGKDVPEPAKKQFADRLAEYKAAKS
jgi:thiol-disulfide isomerase/thioredoxin